MDEQFSEDRSTGGGGHGGASGRWLVSYADFVTLMFVVFVVLYAMAKVDGGKFEQLKTSLGQSSIGGGIQPLPVGGNPIDNTAAIKPGADPQSAPGLPSPINPGTATPAPPLAGVVPPEQTAEPKPEPTPEPASKPATKPTTTPEPTQTKPPVDPMESVSGGFKGTPAASAGEVTVAIQDRGVVVSVLTSVLFAEGQAELKPGATHLLDQISAQLKAHSESVLVEGAPDASDKQAPWDLASRRASAVVTYLVNTHGLAPQRFSVIGYGKGAGVDGIVNVVVLRRQ